MGTKYSSQATSGYNSSPPPDDGTQVAANLISWSAVKTKLADVLKTFAEAINTALVSTLDLSARAIGSNDTAIASDHWKTLQVTGATTITLSSAASMGAGYEVGIFNAGASTVTVTPGLASDTINNVSASVTIPIKGTMIFRTNQALTGYNVVGQSNRMDAGTISGITSLTGTAAMLSPITNSLGADVTLNNAANYFDGPSVAQGSTGTWFVSGAVTVKDTVGGSTFKAKLWDGTTIIASAETAEPAASANAMVIALSGFITSPAGNLRISVRDSSATTGLILFNQSGNSKDSTITAVRIG